MLFRSSQKTAAAVGLGFSLTNNEIDNDTRALVEDSGITAGTTVTVAADSQADIKSLGFGISLGIALSGNATPSRQTPPAR